jgi:predicted lactoylglutathione lyase
MATQIFINMPVKDLNRSVEFFTWLGFTFDPRFTDKNGTCMIVAENIFVMLLTEDKFNSFTQKTIPDPAHSSEAILSLSVDSREKVDLMMDSVFKAGGKELREKQDYGWMYGRGFQDPDGHLWEVFYMDLNAIPQP